MSEAHGLDGLDGRDGLDVIDGLVERIRGLVEAAGSGRVVLGITGAPGAGKSTLTEALLARLAEPSPAGLGPAAVGHLPMDGFHLADAQLDRLGSRDRKGAPDTFDVGGYVAALRRLREEADATLFVPGFERELEQPIAAALAVEPSARVVLTEGNYLLLPDGGWEQVRGLLDEVWYVDLDPGVRQQRLIQRHERYGKSAAAAQEWVMRSDEANADLVAATRDRADLVLTGL